MADTSALKLSRPWPQTQKCYETIASWMGHFTGEMTLQFPRIERFKKYCGRSERGFLTFGEALAKIEPKETRDTDGGTQIECYNRDGDQYQVLGTGAQPARRKRGDD